ncbi:low temperature requirement protein A [Haloferax mucosum ATCC BAA-1512]|uniref:Low temperature requirement protein A n=1 Tax=Haloferax mucosum ATCC BAA-1512 TaxID=662479 RepID=M0IG84_9EURY|nr:low temperature requirement protein A [Haloferax mucosum]ELZ95795.1 low temperature requirement protein A [Haloferax mucosum ATCC BAA-1512]
MTSALSIFSTHANVGESEQEVTPLELFFDLVFVFAMTQVSGFLANHLTWVGIVRGVGLLAVLWWAWVTYSWLTNAIPAEEALPARLVLLTAMAAMLIVALAVPDAFGDDGVLFGLAYFLVRVLHVVLYAIATDPETRDAILRLAPGFLFGPILLIPAGFLDGSMQALLWTIALAVDYGVPLVRGVSGFKIQASHFVERYRLILIIALGESIVAIGVGVNAGDLALTPSVIVAALSGILLVFALWWLYFDYVVLAAERRLVSATGSERAALARDSYSYLHLPMVAGIIFTALGIEQTLAHVGESLGVIPAVALGGGGALYLIGHNLFRFRDTGTISIPRFVVAVGSCLIIPLSTYVSALVSLFALMVLFVGLSGFETARSEFRQTVRGS